MLYILSKLIYWLIMPLSLVCEIFIVSFFTKNKILSKRLLNVGIIALFFFSNPFFAGILMRSWEPAPIKYAQLTKPYDYAVVLSGVTFPDRKPNDRVHFQKGADRIVHAVELYKLGIVNKILVTGGSGTITFSGQEESIQLRKFAILCGVPSEDILVESRARNTRENALYTKELIGENSSKLLLVTSAFHMYRASKCFEKVGLTFDTFPTDYSSGEFRYSLDELIIPSIRNFQTWSILIKEWVGLAAYKTVDYI